ncbi:hypothetical protein [Mucilaginibacter sp. PAMB04168]|uniref:hypothetical protein n=1 Tax=Mucilaginibacter sp. PAMB04168 TaxID=3138567 RepID=UPI0031F6E77F
MNGFDVNIITLPDADTNMAKYLADLFAQSSSPYNELKYEIQREYRFSGSPEVTSMKFDRVIYDRNSGEGSFRVVLDINFTFGCEDIKTEKEDQTSEWTFAINAANQVIHFKGSPYVDSRSTADEF